jgi:hypothetical protein
MAKYSVVGGTTSYIAYVFIQNYNSPIGAGLTGLNETTTNLLATYKRNTATDEIPYLFTNVPTEGIYVASGIKEVSNTRMPGIYSIHIPNTALVTGAQNVSFLIYGASGMVPVPFEIEITATNNQDATAGGLTNLASVYYADIQYTRDAAADEYTTTWFKNANRILAGITSPKITVINRSDGSALFEGSGMTEIGTVHSFKYDEAVNRQASGNAYLVICSGIIDGSVRNYSWLLGRDANV